MKSLSVITCLCCIASLTPLPLLAGDGAAKEVAPPPEMIAAKPDAPVLSGLLSLAWDSAFICEGRNFVEGGGLLSAYLQLDTPFGLSVWTWGADSYNTDFGEVDIGLMYSRMVADFDLGAGWSTGHDYQYDDNFTEFYTWAFYRKYPWLVPGVRWKYGDFAGGTYLELSLASEYRCLAEKLTFTPSAILGLDFGYATEDIDGYNNVQVMLAASYALTEQISLNGYVAYSIGLEDLDHYGDEDLGWGGVSVAIAF